MTDWTRLWRASEGHSGLTGGLYLKDIKAFLKSSNVPLKMMLRKAYNKELQRILESIPEAVIHRPKDMKADQEQHTIKDIFSMDPNNITDAQIINDTISRFMNFGKIYEKMPEIKIGNFSYKLLSKNTSSDRVLYQLISSENFNSSMNDNTLFYAYRSTSECGILRLCNRPFLGLSYDKGFDYAQTSLLHPILQEFINKMENILPDIKFKCKTSGPYGASVADFGAPHSIHSFMEKNYSPCKPRELIHPTLYALTVCNTMQCNIVLRDKITPSNITTKSQKEAIILELDRLEAILGNSVSSDEINNETLVSGISQYLSDKFTYIKKVIVAHLGYNMTIGKPDNNISTGDVYNYVIQDKISKETLNLVVMEYTFNQTPYKIIISVVPDKAQITKVGTYDNYYPAGILAFKPMDYIAQSRRNTKLDFYGDYFFIGNIIGKMWPLQLPLQVKQTEQKRAK